MTLTQTCKITGQPFLITDEDFAFYEKFNLPAPTLCYEERLRRRLSWRNEKNLFQRKCPVTGKNMITMYPPDCEMNVVDKSYWWSDAWDPLDYGQDFDFNRPFFEQFNELNRRVPTPNLAIENDENSDFSNYNISNRNCYLCFTGDFLEDSLYCYNAEESKNCYDCLFVHHCELCYECIQSQDCYNTKFALHCKNCSDSSFIEDCSSCQNCFMCCNLQNKQYYAFNKKVSKQEYEEIIASYKLNTHSGLEKAKEQWEKYRLKHPKRANHNIQTENCSGEYIIQSKNCQKCYLMHKGCEDCKYVFNGLPETKDAMDCSYAGEYSEILYESVASGSSCSRIFFGHANVSGCHETYYSNFIFGCKNCFGCVSMRNKSYCIFNKQYTKQQYEEMLPRIIAHMERTSEWGEFFPSNLSPYPYNLSTAQDFLPLTKEDVIRRGLKWLEPEAKEYQKSTHKEILSCQICSKNYKIIPEELRVYEKLNLPVPHLCFDHRHALRMEKLNPYKNFKRKCAKSGEDIITTYAPEKPEIVYCIKEYREIIE